MYNIDDIFITLIKTIDLVLDNDFYYDTEQLNKCKHIIEKWYESFKQNNTLTKIELNNLKFLDLEISDFFGKYIESEPVEHNYTEILTYYFSNLKRYWKNEKEKDI